MLKSFIITVIFTTSVVAKQPVTHKVFRIKPRTEEHLRILRRFYNEPKGYWIWKEPDSIIKEAHIMVSPRNLNNFTRLMASHNITHRIHIDNVEALMAGSSGGGDRAQNFGWTHYHTLDQIYNWMDSLALRYPNNIRVITIGKSFEGRQMKGVKLSFSNGQNPGVFFEGGIHPREWISPATVTYLLDQFLTSDNPAIRQFAEKYDWYIFPVCNPDGYVFTHANPENEVNRFWRKTRSINRNVDPNNPLCVGTDLNRNWGYQWHAFEDNNHPCSEIYAGRSPFSEVESRSLSDYINSISANLFAYISFHSFAQRLMFPFGFTKAHLPDYKKQARMAEKAVSALKKKYGTKYKVGTIYKRNGATSGGALDWVKGEKGLPMAFVYEMRDTGYYGFLLPPREIIHNSQEVMDSLIALFQQGEKYGYARIS